MLWQIGTGLEQWSWTKNSRPNLRVEQNLISLYNIDLQDNDLKNMFYEMTRFIIVIDENSWQMKNLA